MTAAVACVLCSMEISGHKIDHLPIVQAPYLVVAKDACNYEHGKYSTFLSISDGNIYHCDIPSLTTGKLFVGSHHGWIALVNQFCEPSILNPITGQVIPHPSISTLSIIRPSYKFDRSLDCYYFCDHFDKKFYGWTIKHHRKNITFNRIIFSSDPSSSTDFTVVAIYGPGLDLIFTKPNESKWNLLECKVWFVDLTFHQEKKILALTLMGALHLITFDEKSIANEEICGPLVKADNREHRYLVDSDAYGILQVVRHLKYNDRPTTRAMTVLRLVGDGQGDKTWLIVKTLDGQAIFIGPGVTTPLPTDKVHGSIKPDSVYFTDDWGGRIRR